MVERNTAVVEKKDVNQCLECSCSRAPGRAKQFHTLQLSVLAVVVNSPITISRGEHWNNHLCTYRGRLDCHVKARSVSVPEHGKSAAAVNNALTVAQSSAQATDTLFPLVCTSQVCCVYAAVTRSLLMGSLCSLMMSWCLMSSDVIWHIRDKLWPMPKHGSIKNPHT